MSNNVPVLTRIFAGAAQFSTLKVDSGEMSAGQIGVGRSSTSQIAVKESKPIPSHNAR
nr:hypothetical protein [Nostoc sp. XA010]